MEQEGPARYTFIDEKRWVATVQRPDWYLELVPERERLLQQATETGGFRDCKEEIYRFFEEQLRQGNVFLGREGKDFDAEREPVDTIIIHHTHGSPGMTPERLSAMTLVRLYAPYFANPHYKEDWDIKGKPIFSGHFRNGKQVFWPYHWIVRSDGREERLLLDEEIGWHAKAPNNRRSIAIVLDGNYEDSRPSDVELRAVAQLINSKYPKVDRRRIIGHCEVRNTTCPSKLFLSSEDQLGWKKDLLGLISR